MSPAASSDSSPWAKATAVLWSIQTEVKWKPDKDRQHLAKRKALSHLSENASIEMYNDLICSLVLGPGMVFRYRFGGVDYFAVPGVAQGRNWLVIFDVDGIMETAFPPDDIEHYLAKRAFQYLPTVEEISSR